jgi:glutaredoxin 3
MSVSPALQSAIQKNVVVMFTGNYCGFCTRAKSLLSSKNISFDEHNIETGDNAKLFSEIEKTFRHDTVPAIFIKGKFVGGCSDLQALEKNGKLDQMLKK